MKQIFKKVSSLCTVLLMMAVLTLTGASAVWAEEVDDTVKQTLITTAEGLTDTIVTLGDEDIENYSKSSDAFTTSAMSAWAGSKAELGALKERSGEVEVKSKLGVGSTWTIRLPLTLAIIQALMVVVGDEKYAISLGSIQTLEDISPKDVKLVQNKEVINLRGNVIPLIRLNEVLDVESRRNDDDNLIVVIVKKGDKMAGLVIDELIGQQEIVIKTLGKYIKQCRFISGATILGDGEIALILDTNALI